MHLPMRGIHIFEKPYYREIRPMRGRPMRGPPVLTFFGQFMYVRLYNTTYKCKTKENLENFCSGV